MSEINTYQVILHPGWLLIVPSSKLPSCALGFTVWRGRMLFHLKVTCLHLNNILSASILFLLENHLLNLTTPWVTGRNMNSPLVRDVPPCSGANPFFPSLLLIQFHYHLHHLVSQDPSPNTHTYTQRPLWFRESRQG